MERKPLLVVDDTQKRTEEEEKIIKEALEKKKAYQLAKSDEKSEITEKSAETPKKLIITAAMTVKLEQNKPQKKLTKR